MDLGDFLVVRADTVWGDPVSEEFNPVLEKLGLLGAAIEVCGPEAAKNFEEVFFVGLQQINWRR